MNETLEALSRQVEALKRENSALVARERHFNATGGTAGGRGNVGVASSMKSGEAEKKIGELEQALETVQLEKAVSRIFFTYLCGVH